MDEQKAQKLITAVKLTEICSKLTGFQLAGLVSSCRVGAARVPEVVARKLTTPEYALLYQVVSDQTGREQVQEAAELEHWHRLQTAAQAGILTPN